MSIGVLWFDDSARTLDEKVQAACGRHWIKFGVAANTVYVYPSALGTAATTMVGNVTVKADKRTLLHHYFAVREDDTDTWESLGRGYIDYPEPSQTGGADD